VILPIGGAGYGGGFNFFDSIVTLFLVIAVFWVLYRVVTSSFGVHAPATGPIPLSVLPQAAAPRSVSTDEIKAADPGFDPAAFLNRVRAAFFAVQAAWQERDLTQARPYMGDGLYMSWQAQVRQFEEEGKKNILENLAIDGLYFVEAEHGTGFDHITVRVDAQAGDYEVDEATGKVTFGTHDVLPFTEYWTFERTAGTTTPEAGGILDQKCPNCGAPLEVNEVGECHYCGAAVTSGKFDWVLTRIEQAEEYEGRAAGALTGWEPAPSADDVAAHQQVMARIQHDDTGFDWENFLQHAEMAFFLVEKSWEDRSLGNARAYLSDDIVGEWEHQFAQMEEAGRRPVLENLNVQGAHLTEVLDGDKLQQIKVRFDAVAADHYVDVNTGKTVQGDSNDRRFTTTWTFQRAAGSKTPAGGGVMNQKCPNCGAPLALDEAGACSHCGTAIAGGRFDWVVTRMVGQAGAAAGSDSTV
jgi:predicted lipid-binding transport protein (Tim44 family)